MAAVRTGAEQHVEVLVAMRRKVLLIEDDAGEQELIAEVLKLRGYDVDRASIGAEGLKLLEKNFYDLVLCDVRLPDVSGLEVLAKAKEMDKDLGVIIITAYPSIPNAVKAIQGGAYDYLQKPLNVDHLEHTLDRYFEYYELIRENRRLRQELKKAYSFESLVGKSAAMQEIFERIQLVANSRATVLITGESGTGKELVARAIHYNSPRRNKPFIKTNCAALPEGLIESELFGHEKGAFTGATSSKPGKFELAHNGTIFLDEVADMSAEAQAKILRILQEKRFTRVGGTRMVEVDVRIIAATNRDLKKEIAEGRFREDLYYRLNVVPIHVPPLRDRTEDIPDLAKHFAEQLIHHGWPKKSFSQKALEAMCEYRWPGNVRELKNLVERLMILVPSDVIDEGDVREALGAEAVRLSELDERLNELPLREARKRFERAFIANRLAEFNWNISRTAEALGIERSHLHRKIKELGIQTARSADDAQAEED